MNTIRLISLLVAAGLTGCTTFGDAMGPERPTSDLRESVEAPLKLSEGESPFCKKPENIEVAEPVVQRAPAEPEIYTARLYFQLDKTEFTPESAREAEDVYREILDKDAAEIEIVGHTDTAASDAYNDRLSQRRAERVRADLIARGVDAEIIDISSEGERRLLVTTPDETVEVKNRRVEINAR